MSKSRMIVFALLAAGLFVITGIASGVEWQATWYHMDDPGVFDLEQRIAETSFPFRLSFDWGDEIVLSRSELLASSRWNKRWNKIGFKATCSFFVQDSASYRFLITANNGFRLFVDGDEFLVSWEETTSEGALRTEGNSIELLQGFHHLELWYYEWFDRAQITFYTDLEALGLEAVSALLLAEALQSAQLKDQLEDLTYTQSKLKTDILNLRSELKACSTNRMED